MGRVIWYSSWNFTPDLGGKILIDKPRRRYFLIPGEDLDYEGIKDLSNDTLKGWAPNVKLILGVAICRKHEEADSLAGRESASLIALTR
jgi:hypothetical protein